MHLRSRIAAALLGILGVVLVVTVTLRIAAAGPDDPRPITPIVVSPAAPIDQPTPSPSPVPTPVPSTGPPPSPAPQPVAPVPRDIDDLDDDLDDDDDDLDDDD